MFTEGITYQKTISMITEICCKCGIAFGMPSDLNERFRNYPDEYFFCPNGHSQHYSKSKAQRLVEEAEQKLRQRERELANVTVEKIQLESELNKAKWKLNRVHNGTCPCCKRSFTNLKRHIESKHPELLTDKKL